MHLSPAVISSAFLLAGAAFAAGDAQKDMDQWQQLMLTADGAVEKKAHGDELLKALEAPDRFHTGHIDALKGHPDYPKAHDRQLALRLNLVKLYANLAFGFAKSAAEKKDGKLLSQRGGAFARMDQATATLAAYVADKGEADPGGQKMTEYVAGLKKQVDSVGAQLNVTVAAAATPDPAPVDKGTQNNFNSWVEKLAEAEKASAAGDRAQAKRALDAALKVQDGWDFKLKSHPDYAKTLARQQALATALSTGAVEPAIEAALAQAKQGFEDKNANFFRPSAGPYQKLNQARASLAAVAKAKGAQDPEVVRLTKALEAAEQQIDALGKRLTSEALAKRETPPDVYSGSDKSALKAQILAHWKKKYPNDKVLGVRFVQAAWTRETNWKANATSVYKTDYSWLGAKVVVQTSDEVATIYPAFANKQQASDQVLVTDDRAGNSYAVDQMLMKNTRL